MDVGVHLDLQNLSINAELLYTLFDERSEIESLIPLELHVLKEIVQYYYRIA